MAALPEPLFMTVEEYRQLPDQPGVVQELHWGQLVYLAFPKKEHADLQFRLMELLLGKARHLGVVRTEFAFRALPEYDVRGADIAFVSRSRYEAVAKEDNLHGSPELVIEVLSPSNTKAEMREKATLCLSTGAKEFWIVDPNKKTVTVLSRESEARVYATGDSIPLTLFGGTLEVSRIFD